MPDDLTLGRMNEVERGREAEHPQDIPSRGWKDVLWRAWGALSANNMFLVAGGVTDGLTFALIACGMVIVALVAVLAAAVQAIGPDSTTKWLLLLLEWPLLRPPQCARRRHAG